MTRAFPGILRGRPRKAGTIAATVAAGPLNYVGANPKVDCTVSVSQAAS